MRGMHDDGEMNGQRSAVCVWTQLDSGGIKYCSSILLYVSILTALANFFALFAVSNAYSRKRRLYIAMAPKLIEFSRIQLLDCPAGWLTLSGQNRGCCRQNGDWDMEMSRSLCL